MNDWVALLIVASVLGTGGDGGRLFAFSTFVIRALARLPSAHGKEAMQEINQAVINPWLLGVGTAVSCLVLGDRPVDSPPVECT